MQPAGFDRLAVFGDSLSDAGAIFALTSDVLAIPFPLESAGYAGVLSNGPVYSQRLAGLLGVEADVFAVASAQAIGERPLWRVLGLDGNTPPFDGLAAPLVLPGTSSDALNVDVNLGAQIDRFLAAPPATGTTAAAFLIGLNDIATLETDSPTLLFDALALLNGIVSATEDAVQAVTEAGHADEIVLYGFPNAGFLPGASDLDDTSLAALDILIGLHALALDRIAAEAVEDGTPARVIDLASLTREIDADPGTFGFAAKGPVLLGSGTDPEIGPPDPVTGLPTLDFPRNPDVADLDEDAVQFFDLLHPTTALHGTIAAYSEAVLTSDVAIRPNLSSFTLEGAGADLVLARGGSDIVVVGQGHDVVLGGTGSDTVFGGSGMDLLAGGSGNDVLRGSFGRDVLIAGAGHDQLFGGGGHDILVAGSGGDALSGGAGADAFLFRGADAAGADTLYGGSGTDTLFVIRDALTEEVFADAVLGIGADDPAAGNWSFEPVNLTLRGIEQIRLIDAPDDIPGRAATVLEEAEAWGFV